MYPNTIAGKRREDELWEKTVHANKYRKWQGWAQMARAEARNIPGGSDETITIQSWDGGFVEITKENVEEIIEEKRPEGSQ